MLNAKRDRFFMRMSIEEMLLSRSEHTNKYDPMVGAVLVNNRGRVLAKAHRGNFSAGDHAEFTLLEKVVDKANLKGHTIYVTLEPCTKRNSPKKPCAYRIVERGIDKVVIGISDPNPAIHGRGIEYLLNQGVVVDFFDNDLSQEIQDVNKDFINYFYKSSLQADVAEEKVTVEERISMKPEATSYEEKRPVFHSNKQDLDRKLISEYFKGFGGQYKLPSKKAWEQLCIEGFLRIQDDNYYIPTYAGILLFGKTPDKFLPNFIVRILHFESNDPNLTIMEQLKRPPFEFCGSLSKIVEKTVDYIINNVPKVPMIEGILRKEVPEYPEEVLREIIVNALVHRDYSLDDMSVFVEIYPNRIIVKSPGGLMRPITLERLRTFERIGSRCRNPRIAVAFNHMELMEKAGIGIPTIAVILERNGLRRPNFDYIDGYFTVTLYGRSESPISLRISAALTDKLNKRQLDILDYISKFGRITSEDFVNHFKMTRETANQDFRALMSYGLIEKRGRGRGTYYILGDRL